MEILVPAPLEAHYLEDPIDRSQPLVFQVPDVLSKAECEGLMERIDALGPAPAPISMAHGFVMRPDLRNNTRVIFDDVSLAAVLYARLAHALPARMRGRLPVSANERFRGYRYEPTQRFAAHYDGSFCRNPHEASELTLLIYLNEDFVGGETAFLQHGLAVRPRRGLALLFQHGLLHEGCPVRSGVKYVLRSDVMYRDEVV